MLGSWQRLKAIRRIIIVHRVTRYTPLNVWQPTSMLRRIYGVCELFGRLQTFRRVN
jgi:hypothetical protein